ncbi:portal_HK97, phage portal protein, HK97 family [uncultured Caudovirales phage]|uniref:Portal_HK97, phage portal protein, HK97 family n=1 Tax=uncultured Caudovirales phage TaxID=2100421 RepID=A0A6J5MVP0_9CAUD|nr:portal_HK97, phage portal protein, HK97 family [uncultured Caudovirales phage]
MGLFDRKPKMLEAQAAPQIMGDAFYSSNYYYSPAVTRYNAMTVPAVKRCRDLLCTVGTIPLEYKKKSTGEEIAAPRWVHQLSRHQPQFVTMSYLVDSLLFFGQAFLEITETYQEDGRGAVFEWVANTRVTTEVDPYGQFVTQYLVDGKPRPMSGLGSLVTFQSFNEGILTTGARTIQAAIDVQKAAAIAAGTPMATGYLKNTGADLPPTEVQGLLSAWKSARQNRSTAYLTSTLNYETVGFSPKEMLYNEAIQNLATEVSRLCGVPSYYLSADQNTSMTYSNILDERKQLVALAFQPYISAIEQRLSMDDISTAGHYVKFDLDSSFLRVDPMERLLVLEKMLALGLITTEQAMEMEDLTPNGSDD